VKLKTSFNSTTQSFLEARIDAIQASAKRFGGYCIWPFSQLKYPVKSLLRAHQDSFDSVCEMFAAKWLAEHARGGSVVNWMSMANSDIIDASKVLQLRQYFTIGAMMHKGALSVRSGKSHGAMDQSRATETWLRSQGVIKRRQISGGNVLATGASDHSTNPASSRNFSEQIARQVVQSNSSYKMIALEGACCAHAMAAWSDQDVSFFDPNFGEFWFARPQDFVAWLAAFWHLAGYDTPALGLNQNYSIQEYGFSVNKQ
jgi:YopT peptidase